MNIKLIALALTGLLIVSLAGTVFYYRAEYLSEKVKTTQLEANLSTAKAANESLVKASARTKRDVERYVASMNKMGEANTELNAKLSGMRSKLAQHKLLKLRQGRHSELGLKIINKSIVKLQREWMK